MNTEERAKYSATAIIEWCLAPGKQDEEDDPNFATSEVARAMRWQRQQDIDKACRLLDALYLDICGDRCKVFNTDKFREMMEKDL